MTDAEFKTWTRHTAENLQAQRDDAIARIDQRDAEHADLLKSHTDALAAKDASHAEALTKSQADAAAALQTERDKAAAVIAEKAKLESLINELGSEPRALELRKLREIAKTKADILAAEQAKVAAAAKLAELEAEEVKIIEGPDPIPSVPKVRG